MPDPATVRDLTTAAFELFVEWRDEMGEADAARRAIDALVEQETRRHHVDTGDIRGGVINEGEVDAAAARILASSTWEQRTTDARVVAAAWTVRRRDLTRVH